MTRDSYSQLELMQARVKSVPSNWLFSYVGKVFDIKNTFRKPISDEIRQKNPGQYPYYGPTKIQGFIDTYEQDGEFALIGEDGDHFLKFRNLPMTQLIEGKCTVNNHAHIVAGTNSATREWFYYYFMHRDIFSFLTRQGAGRFKLNKAALEHIPLLVPPLPEQKKIAEILSTWDKAITTTEQLLANSQQHKKALMQQLLTGKKRLHDHTGQPFTGEWHNCHIGKLLKESRIPSSLNNPDNRLTVRLNLKGIEKREFRGTESIDATAHFIRKSGQFIYGKQNIHKGSFGLIPNEFDGFETSQDLPAFDFIGICEPSWFFYYVSQSWFHQSLENRMSGTGSKRLSPSEFFKVRVLLPELKEQQKIAAVLTAADQEIDTLKQKLDHLKQEKKALMQQLLTGKKRVLS
ncbi:restriction endonuclease subunit S [Thiomicrorhabdus chilensis]|uniref:restriction endonuclease subunit S n=1 Tax=Thiomicrorhabdus chilensis TaxID=63656 RepID=UPI00040BE20B|nr:restriction endonuclease subunit S [Thiomicrorhabdus chilensis]